MSDAQKQLRNVSSRRASYAIGTIQTADEEKFPDSFPFREWNEMSRRYTE
jgi:hypothetical protein